MSRRGEVCGAVTGALMALGLAQGADTPAGKEKAYQLGQDFLQRFEIKHGTILCRELIDSDISTPEGHQQARASGVFTASARCSYEMLPRSWRLCWKKGLSVIPFIMGGVMGSGGRFHPGDLL